MNRLEGKVAIVSGAASGIGAATARLFAAEGARVVAGDVNEALGASVVEEIVAVGGKASFLRLDAADETQWAAVVTHVTETHGSLTTLVNNAGMFLPGGVEDTPADQWQRLVDVNQKGVWLGMRAALPALKASGNGAIVNMSSILGIVGDGGSFAYSATKGAIRLMTKSAALEQAPHGVRINSIHPGMIMTALLADVPKEILRSYEQAIPLGRIADPSEVAHAALYLCSDDARYVTGSELVIDGGLTAR